LSSSFYHGYFDFSTSAEIKINQTTIRGKKEGKKRKENISIWIAFWRVYVCVVVVVVNNMYRFSDSTFDIAAAHFDVI
jgi:hypothetical protein